MNSIDLFVLNLMLQLSKIKQDLDNIAFFLKNTDFFTLSDIIDSLYKKKYEIIERQNHVIIRLKNKNIDIIVNKNKINRMSS